MKQVFVTGANGRLGELLLAHLANRNDVSVAGLDVVPVDNPDILTADLTGPFDWKSHLNGVDTIVHFAGDTQPSASWSSAASNNFDATLRLLHFARLAEVSRVILASSNWVLADKRFTDKALNSKTLPGPVNPYGASKLFVERAGAHFAECHDMSVICVRIGWVDEAAHPGYGTKFTYGDWGMQMRLSERDFLNGMTAAIDAQDIDFCTINLVSNNAGMRWDLTEAKETIGYEPMDYFDNAVPRTAVLKSRLRHLLDRVFRRISNSKLRDW